MRRLLRVAANEYRGIVFRKSFVIIILSVPFMLAFTIGLGAVLESRDNNSAPIGYVDDAGLLADPIFMPQPADADISPTNPAPVALLAFDSEAAARAALLAGELQAYYVVSEDFAGSNRVDLVYVDPPGKNATSQFWNFMQLNRLADLPPKVAERAVAGTNVIARWPAEMPGGGREFDDRVMLGTFMPALMGMAVIMLLLMISSYLMGAVAEEKENRTMEIVVTSISPNQLMGGKVVGICAVALTQVSAWGVVIYLAAVVSERLLGFSLPPLELRPMLELALIAIPTLVLFAALMVAMGAVSPGTHEAQQMTGLLALPMWAPYWLAIIIIRDGGGALATGLSFFPLTALSTFSLRIVLTPVPIWQVVLSVVIQTLFAIGAIWLAARAFRLGMLQYGQRLRWRELFAVRQSATPSA